MPSKKQYNLVNDDAYDSRIPLYNDEAFQHGITFHAKYIGSLEVPRPSSRLEIVAAMRRIRYEFKAKSIKKRKVSLTVSVDGVKVVPRLKRSSNRWPWEENKVIILHHPIYRIFYVSHDSQDLKIFSYIARDGGTNAFKCNVFKSKKKSQAMRIVRTIGQAFEVCHKLSLALATSNSGEERNSLSGNDEVDALSDQAHKGKTQGDGASEPNSCDTQEETLVTKPLNASNQCSPLMPEKGDNKKENEGSPLTASSNNNIKLLESTSFYYHIQLLKDQLEQQNLQMQTIGGQIQLLKDHLSAETSARVEAQVQNQHLITYNRELLEYIKNIVDYIHQIETKCFKNNKLSDNLSHDPFQTSMPPAPESYALQNHKFSAGNNDKSNRSGIGHPLFDNQFSADPLTQISIPNAFSKDHSNTNSPRLNSSATSKLGVSFSNAGVSLPTSPSSLSFSPNLDAIFKPDSFVCSSPKQSRKSKNLNPSDDFLPLSNSIPHSPSLSQSSASPGQRARKQQVFDFEKPPTSYSRALNESDFKFSGNPSSSGIHNSDSFVAQVTRDLAKMNTVEKSLSDSASGTKPYSNSNFSFFKS